MSLIHIKYIPSSYFQFNSVHHVDSNTFENTFESTFESTFDHTFAGKFSTFESIFESALFAYTFESTFACALENLPNLRAGKSSRPIREATPEHSR